MRVLHIGLTAHKGGTEAFVYNYMDIFFNKGILFDFVDIYGEGLAEENDLIKAGSKIYRLANYKRNPFKVYRDIQRIVTVNRYKIVHIHMQSAANLLPAKAVISCGVRPILHSHNTAAVGKIRTFLHNLNCKRLREMDADHLACGKEAGKWMWGEKEYIVIPNAVSPNSYHFSDEWRKEIRKELNLSENINIVGVVGRITYEKNPYFFVKLVKAMIKKGMDNTVILMIGTGNLLNDIKEIVNSQNLSRNFIIYGPSRFVNKMYSAMDCFILPSFFEGLPFVGVEAQACGLPVVFSDNVTTEIDISHSVKHLNLTDIDQWISSIEDALKKTKDDRLTIQNEFRNSIFNIINSAQRLETIYRRKEEQ